MLSTLFFGILAALSPFLLPGCLEASVFYHPRPNHAATPAGYEEVRFPTTDGLSLHGWFLPALGHDPQADDPAPTVLHVHGNSGSIAGHRFAVEFLPSEGFNVLLFDYRSFGDSDQAKGYLRREWLVEDTEAALDYLLRREDVDPDRVALFGYSLGAVLGLAVAAEREEVRAVVEYAGFASWEGVAADKAGFLGRWLIAPGFDAVDSVAALGERPLLIVHGTRDRVVAFRHARVLREAAEAAGVPVEFLRIEGGTHISIGSDPVVQAAVVEFLQKHLRSP